MCAKTNHLQRRGLFVYTYSHLMCIIYNSPLYVNHIQFYVCQDKSLTAKGFICIYILAFDSCMCIKTFVMALEGEVGGWGRDPKKMYGKRFGDGVEYHLMSPFNETFVMALEAGRCCDLSCHI